MPRAASRSKPPPVLVFSRAPDSKASRAVSPADPASLDVLRGCARVLIGEMFASQSGLGFMIRNAIGLHDVATIMATILILAIVAVSASTALLWLDRRLHHRAA